MRGPTTVSTHRGLSPHQFTPMSGAHIRSALDARTALYLHTEVHWPGASESERCVPHHSHEGVTSLGVGYGTFILDPTPVRGFLGAEVQWTRNPSDAAVRRWSPSTAWEKLASKRGACDKAPVWQQFHAS